MTAGNPTGGGTRAPAVCKDFTESQLEAAISAAADLIAHAPTREERVAACTALSALHAQRSISQVRFLERLRGLR